MLSLTKQSYDIFCNYGTEPEALENMFLGFQKVLERCTIEEIEKAFGLWIYTKKTMPRPCNILKRCLPDWPETPKAEAKREEVTQFIEASKATKELIMFMTGGIPADEIED